MTDLPTVCDLVLAVRAAQRREVAALLRRHPDATPEELGAALVLPVWTVRCRLAELAGQPVPWVRKPAPARKKKSILERRTG